MVSLDNQNQQTHRTNGPDRRCIIKYYKNKYQIDYHCMNILDELWKVRNPKDALFLELIEGYTIKESNDYDCISYMKGETMLIKYDKKTKNCWINYHLIWSVFQSIFSINYEETRELLRGMLESYLKLKAATPFHDNFYFYICWRHTSN